jgi:TPR repeat protein
MRLKIQLIRHAVNQLLAMIRKTLGIRSEGALISKKLGIATGEFTMELARIDTANTQVLDTKAADLLVARALTAAAQGNMSAYFDLGVVYSTGSHGVASDLVEAHKWFNIAASQGHEDAAYCRADVADEMTAREIAEAQRRARQWLAQERRRAA